MDQAKVCQDVGLPGVESQFQKTYSLPTYLDQTLELIDDVVDEWSDDKLTSMCDELNRTKSLLNEKPLSQWHMHTKKQNPAGKVLEKVRKSACNPELLTQAWCKFTEILNRFELVDLDSLKSCHLCEAPGAFVTALNHHLRSKSPPVKAWDWMASTLHPHYEGNPTHSMINDDRFLIHTLDRWNFGLDGTGDICKPINLNHLIEEMSGDVDLITADGSVDCQNDPARQESIVAQLHLAETTAAMSGLKDGGHFVIKMFTFYECQSVSLLYLLSHLFASLDVFKPATSKEGNSEVYVVARAFKKANFTANTKKVLLNKVATHDGVLFAQNEVKEEFMQELRKCSAFFKDLQSKVITRNLATFEMDPIQEYDAVRDDVAQEFVCRYGIKPIRRDAKIVTSRRSSFKSGSNLDQRVEPATFSSRFCSPEKSDLRGRYQALCKKLADTKVSLTFKKVEWCQIPFGSELNLRRGKRLQNIVSSKFCPSQVIDLFHQASELLKDASSPSPDCRQQEKRMKMEDGPSLRVAVDRHPNAFCQQALLMHPDIHNGAKILTFEVLQPHEYLESCLPSRKAVRQTYFATLLEELKTLQRGDHLMVCNFPLFSRLFAGILLLISQCFEEIGFVRPRGNQTGILLAEFGGDASKILQQLDFIDEALGLDQPYDVLEVVPVQALCQEPFYSSVVAVNVLNMKETSAFLLEHIKQHIS